MQNNEYNTVIPVYLFLGFLGAGKTRFIQKTLQSDEISERENVLLILFEEGTEEYDFSRIKNANVSLAVFEDKEELSAHALLELAVKSNAGLVIIEYNGVLHTSDLMVNMPKNWQLAQCIFIADASSFIMYSKSFWGITSDKLNLCELVLFNRYEDSLSMEELHKTVRSVNRRADIIYEYSDGRLTVDDIQDPLPFNKNDEHIIIRNSDYAVWYSDIMADPKSYEGKLVTFNAVIHADERLPENVFSVGRYVMTCCVQDMAFCRFIAFFNRYFEAEDNDWAGITAVVGIKHSEEFDMDIPLLYIRDIYYSEPPENMIAEF